MPTLTCPQQHRVHFIVSLVRQQSLDTLLRHQAALSLSQYLGKCLQDIEAVGSLPGIYECLHGPQDIARQFCAKHGLDAFIVDHLEEHIRDNLERAAQDAAERDDDERLQDEDAMEFVGAVGQSRIEDALWNDEYAGRGPSNLEDRHANLASIPREVDGHPLRHASGSLGYPGAPLASPKLTC
jgi:hypothetical protein